ALRLLLPDRRPRAAGRHDRRHCADAASPPRGEAPACMGAEFAHQGDRHRDQEGATRSGHRGEGVMTIGLGHYLTVAAILFTLGIFGIFLNRKNVIIILMSVELILLAVNISLVSFSAFLGDLVGQVFALLVLTVA